MALLTRRWHQARKAIQLVGSRTGRHGLRYGVGASIEHREAFRGNTFRSVVDVGANRGQFSLFCMETFPNASVFAFEPLAAPASRYRAVFGGTDSFTLFHAAIGPADREATIHVSNRDDSSSLLPIGELQNKLFPGTNEVGLERITVGRLGTYISSENIVSPALLKIDVQGYELEVLRGCSDLLEQFERVYVECSYVELYEGQHLVQEVVAFLSEHSFELVGEFNKTEDDDLGPIQADLMFARKT